jgi:hypothetical protein
MTELAKTALRVARDIQAETPSYAIPPDEGLPAWSQQVIPLSIVRGTRGYLEKTANQINGCYQHGWFDACAVMIRRLVETVIIEAFEHNGIAHKIQDGSGNFVRLEQLINAALGEQSWNLGRDTKRGLPRLKSLGDFEKVVDELRVVVQEMVYLAGLK